MSLAIYGVIPTTDETGRCGIFDDCKAFGEGILSYCEMYNIFIRGNEAACLNLALLLLSWQRLYIDLQQSI